MRRRRVVGRAAGRVMVAAAVVALLGSACSSGSSTGSETASGGTAAPPTAARTEAEGAPSTTADDEATDIDADDDPTSTTADDDGPTSTTADEDDDTIGPAEGVLAAAQPGDEGDSIVALQERLAKVGFGPGPADGSYGRRTERAVEAFQTLAGLEVTGVADDGTISALRSFTYDGVVLHAGDEGAEVEELQQRLANGPFDPGPIDGEYGTATTQAVWALEKLAGIPVDGDWGPLDQQAWEKLEAGSVGQPTQSHDQRWVEVDLSEQLMKVYEPGSSSPMLISHISSGSGQAWSNENHSGSSITPLGDFSINRRISGWRESSLDIGRLYNPLYFNGGIAFHGALSVPLYPASHGCVRVPMHVAEYLPGELPNGTPVHVLA